METVEFKKVYKAYYSPKPGQPEIVTLPAMQFAMVDGRGDPNNSADFQNAIGALYGLAYGLKFGRKKAGVEPDFTIGALEALWWTMAGKTIGEVPKKDWLWTVMIWLPALITGQAVKHQIKLAQAKKPNPALGAVRLENYNEGTAVQIMHIGPYGEEQPNIELMHRFAKDSGYELSGKHHEIYLGDPRRAAPEKLKTILRQPIQAKQ